MNIYPEGSHLNHPSNASLVQSIDWLSSTISCGHIIAILPKQIERFCFKVTRVPPSAHDTTAVAKDGDGLLTSFKSKRR